MLPSELINYFENNLYSLSEEDLLQLFNYDIMNSICALDKIHSVPYYYTTKILQELENRLADKFGKEPAIIKIDNNIKTSEIDLISNVIKIKNFTPLEAILQPIFLVHEDRHSNQIICLKHQNAIDSQLQDCLNVNKQNLNSLFPLIKLQSNTPRPTLVYQEDELLQLHITQISGSLIETYVFRNFPYLSDETMSILIYTTTQEIDARKSEWEITEKMFNEILKESNIYIKQEMLSKFSELITRNQELLNASLILLEPYINITKYYLNTTLLEKNIFKPECTENYIKNSISDLSQKYKNLFSLIDVEKINIENLKREFHHSLDYQNLNNAFNSIIQIKPLSLFSPKYQNSLLSSLETLVKEFNVSYFECKIADNNINMQNLNIDEALIISKNDNLLYLLEKLLKIYNNMDKKICRYNDNIKLEVKHNIEEFFTKILLNEKTSYLMNIGIPHKVFDIVEYATSLKNETQQNVIQEKLTHYKELYDISKGKLPVLSHNAHSKTKGITEFDL